MTFLAYWQHCPLFPFYYLRTDLGLRHHGVVPVAERRELEPHLGLAVALHEELLDAARGPLVVHVPRLE